MEYNFREIEKKWHQKWVENKTYKVVEDENKKKFYVLNMFPYPSGAGLHVGHPLGYIASDIYARYKRLNGFNVLDPMGYDAYGLPAEQYAIQTGQHPEITTVANINRYREQLDKIGFCFDWDREVRTCDPKYYHWTQWAFQKMFNSFFCNGCQKAQPIEKLIKRFEEKGSEGLNVAQNEQIDFTAEEWNSFNDVKKQQILTKDGLFSKSKILQGNFNREYFTKIDIRVDRDIKLYSKDAKVLTSHPASSYRLTADANKQLTLRITDPQAFWSTSKYLVVQVK